MQRNFVEFFGGLAHEAVQHEKSLVARAARKIRRVEHNMFDNPFKSEGGVTGRMREDMLFHVLDNTVGYGKSKISRTPAQKEFHRLMFLANVEHVYGDSLAANVADIKRRHNVTGDFKSIVAIMSFRRGGKTTGLTMFAQAMLVAVGNSIQNLYSTGSRASELALNLVHAFLCAYDGGSWVKFIAAKNNETLKVRLSNLDVRIFNAMPSDAKISFLYFILHKRHRFCQLVYGRRR